MSSAKNHDALKTIGEVATEIGVATHVIRFWESKFLQIQPQKRRGRRYYAANQVTVIKTIKELLYEDGYTIKGVLKHLAIEKKEKLAGKNLALAAETPPSPEPDSYTILAENNNIPNFNNTKIEQLKEIYTSICDARAKLEEFS